MLNDEHGAWISFPFGYNVVEVESLQQWYQSFVLS